MKEATYVVSFFIFRLNDKYYHIKKENFVLIYQYNINELIKRGI